MTLAEATCPGPWTGASPCADSQRTHESNQKSPSSARNGVATRIEVARRDGRRPSPRRCSPSSVSVMRYLRAALPDRTPRVVTRVEDGWGIPGIKPAIPQPGPTRQSRERRARSASRIAHDRIECAVLRGRGLASNRHIRFLKGSPLGGTPPRHVLVHAFSRGRNTGRVGRSRTDTLIAGDRSGPALDLNHSPGRELRG
jgi:hypothetical protein